MNPYYRPRRSMLYVPGCNARYLNKARSVRVDSVILDLGDPILVEKKVESRRLVTEAVLFPNIESHAHVDKALSALDAAGGSHLPIMLMIESPVGVLRAEEIA